MPRIINTFAQTENPLAKAISAFGESMFGDTLTPALKKQQLRDLQRAEFGVEGLAGLAEAANSGVMDPNQAAKMGILGGVKPEDAAMWNTFLAGNKLGPRATGTTNAMAGAGKYKESAENLDLDRRNVFDMNTADNTQSGANNAADNAQKLLQFNQTPIEATIDGRPGFVRQGEAAPSLDQMAALEYSNQNAKRNLPATQNLEARLREAVTDVYGPGYKVQVFSGGQVDQAHGAGSVRHNGGKAADVRVIGPDGQQVTGDALSPLGQYWAAKKYGGVGMEMKGGGIHLDEWSTPPAGGGMSWSYADQGGQYTPGMDQAIQAGLRGELPATQGRRPEVAPIMKAEAANPLQKFQDYLTAADAAMPGATPEQKRQWALEQISKQKSGKVVRDSEGNILYEEGSGMDLTNANTTRAQGAEMEAAQFDSAINMAKDLIRRNPDSVGLMGFARGAVQDTATLAKNFGRVFGIADIDKSLMEARNQLASEGVSPDVLNFDYDPSISQIESVVNLLVYKSARASQGSGDKISNDDIVQHKLIIGDPSSWMTNPERLIGNLEQLQRYVASQRAINKSFLEGKGAPAAGPAAAPSTGGTATTPTKGIKWYVK